MIVVSRTIRVSILCVCIVLILMTTTMPGSANADSCFISASMVRSLFEDTYPWFLDGTVKEQLFLDVELSDLKLFGFQPDHEVSEERAFFLVSHENGTNKVKDISSQIDTVYTYYYADTVELSCIGEVIRLDAYYITHHVLPALYLISNDGVLLGVKGELIEVEEGPPFTVTHVDYSDSEMIPWNIGPGTVHPLGEKMGDGFFWSSVDAFQAWPYIRHVCEWRDDSRTFEVVDMSPLNHAAVTETFVHAVSKYDWEEAAQFLIGVRWTKQDDFESDPVIVDLLSGVEEFIGFPNPNTIRLKTMSGNVIDFVFDSGWEESYQSARRKFEHEHRQGMWAPQPKITALQRTVCE